MAFLSTHWPILALAYIGANVFIVSFFAVGAGERTPSDAARQNTDEQDGPLGDLIALPKDFPALHANPYASEVQR